MSHSHSSDEDFEISSNIGRDLAVVSETLRWAALLRECEDILHKTQTRLGVLRARRDLWNSQVEALLSGTSMVAGESQGPGQSKYGQSTTEEHAPEDGDPDRLRFEQTNAGDSDGEDAFDDTTSSAAVSSRRRSSGTSKNRYIQRRRVNPQKTPALRYERRYILPLDPIGTNALRCPSTVLHMSTQCCHMPTGFRRDTFTCQGREPPLSEEAEVLHDVALLFPPPVQGRYRQRVPWTPRADELLRHLVIALGIYDQHPVFGTMLTELKTAHPAPSPATANFIDISIQQHIKAVCQSPIAERWKYITELLTGLGYYAGGIGTYTPPSTDSAPAVHRTGATLSTPEVMLHCENAVLCDANFSNFSKLEDEIISAAVAGGSWSAKPVVSDSVGVFFGGWQADDPVEQLLPLSLQGSNVNAWSKVAYLVSHPHDTIRAVQVGRDESSQSSMDGDTGATQQHFRSPFACLQRFQRVLNVNFTLSELNPRSTQWREVSEIIQKTGNTTPRDVFAHVLRAAECSFKGLPNGGMAARRTPRITSLTKTMVSNIAFHLSPAARRVQFRCHGFLSLQHVCDVVNATASIRSLMQSSRDEICSTTEIASAARVMKILQPMPPRTVWTLLSSALLSVFCFDCSWTQNAKKMAFELMLHTTSSRLLREDVECPMSYSLLRFLHDSSIKYHQKGAVAVPLFPLREEHSSSGDFEDLTVAEACRAANHHVEKSVSAQHTAIVENIDDHCIPSTESTTTENGQSQPPDIFTRLRQRTQLANPIVPHTATNHRQIGHYTLGKLNLRAPKRPRDT